jgi:hypothetical protein
MTEIVLDLDEDDREPENPLLEGDSEYSVRLVFRVKANDPEHARTRFISMLNEFGMNVWTYRVTDTDNEDEFLVKDGEVLTPEEFAAQESEDEAATEFLRGEGLLGDEDEIETVVDPDARV